MSQLTLKPKTSRGFINCLSGLFITQENPQGLTHTELSLITALQSILTEQNKTVIDKDIKIKLANLSNNKLQVITNYINRLKSKKVITQDNKLHTLFYKNQIVINYEGN